jgi:hypothetical protein
VTTVLVVVALIALLLLTAVVARRSRPGTVAHRLRAIEQERQLCQQRVLCLTQQTLAAMRAAMRQEDRDDG